MNNEFSAVFRSPFFPFLSLLTVFPVRGPYALTLSEYKVPFRAGTSLALQREKYQQIDNNSSIIYFFVVPISKDSAGGSSNSTTHNENKHYLLLVGFGTYFTLSVSVIPSVAKMEI